MSIGQAKRAKTGGRRRGTPNKRTVNRERAVAAAAEKVANVLGDAAFEGDAHAFLMTVYKDGQNPVGVRIEAARAAIGYEKPRLGAVDAKVHAGPTLADLVLASYRGSESTLPAPIEALELAEREKESGTLT